MLKEPIEMLQWLDLTLIRTKPNLFAFLSTTLSPDLNNIKIYTHIIKGSCSCSEYIETTNTFKYRDIYLDEHLKCTTNIM